MISPEAFIVEARAWLGVPFRHQGRSRVGTDCAGYVEVLARSMGMLPSSYRARRNYGRAGAPELVAVIEQCCTKIENAEPATLLLIKWPGHPHPSHLAICAGETMIHCYQRVGRVVEHGYRAQWIRDTHAIYRLPGIAYPPP